MPSSLLQQVAEGDMKYSANAAITHDDEVNRMEQMRCAAISAFHWLDSHERLRVALNARSKPPKLVALTPGTQVYFHKPPAQHRRLQDNATGQQGPAVVAATEGVDKVWLRYKGTVVRVALENIRLATPEESLDTRYITDVLHDMQQELTGEKRVSGYEDLVEGAPASETATPVSDQMFPISSGNPTTDVTRPEPSQGTMPSEASASEPNLPVVPSLQLSPKEATPEVLAQVDQSRRLADQLDGHAMRKPRVEPYPTRASSDTRIVEGVGSMPVKDKVSFFDQKANPMQWQEVGERIQADLPASSESTIVRARRLHDLGRLEDSHSAWPRAAQA